MGRREQPVEPGPLFGFAQDLRSLRASTGLTYRALARTADYSASALSAAASGQALPTLALTLAFVRACGGDVEQWRHRWHQLAESLRATHAELLLPGTPTPGPSASAPPPVSPPEPEPPDTSPAEPAGSAPDPASRPRSPGSDQDRDAANRGPAVRHFAPLRPSDPARVGALLTSAPARRRPVARAGSRLTTTSGRRIPVRVGVPALILTAAAVVSALILYDGTGTTIDPGALPPPAHPGPASSATDPDTAAPDTSVEPTITPSTIVQPTTAPATSARTQSRTSTRRAATPGFAPAAAGLAPPTLLGAPDFNGYCQATGQGPVQLVENDAYGWRCSADNGTGDDAQAVCSWTFHITQITNTVTSFYDPNSWHCWRATRQLGAPDFNGYCQATGQGPVQFVENDAYGWRCSADNGVGDDAGAVCRWQYGSNPPVARFQNFYDANSWQCWG